MMRPETKPPPPVGGTGAAVKWNWLGGSNSDTEHTATAADVQLPVDLHHELAIAQRLAGRYGLDNKLQAYGITPADQIETDVIAVDRILVGAGRYSPLPHHLPTDRLSRPSELWCLTPIRSPAGEVFNVVAWRPNSRQTYVRMRWPALLGCGIGDDPIDRALICDEPLVVYGTVAAWHRQAHGPGVVWLNDDVSELWGVDRALTDDMETLRKLRVADVDARFIAAEVDAHAA